MRQNKPNCSHCEHHKCNDTYCDVRTKKGMLKAHKEYCEHPKIGHKEISRRAKGCYDYPVWCPMCEVSTCMMCGTTIRPEEGDYCRHCR